MMLKSYSGISDKGPLLNINEDNWGIDLENDLYLVVDGFGGSGIGDIVGNRSIELIKHFYSNIGGDPDATFPFYFSPKYFIESNALINAFNYTHKAILDENISKDMFDRGGASAIAIGRRNHLISVVSTGNCNAYLYRDGRLSQLITPDNLELFCRDVTLKEHATVPLSGIGLFEDLHLSIKEASLIESDLVIMMTDGAYARLRDKELKAILDQPKDTKSKIEEIFSKVNSRGNLDNQTILMLQF